MAENKTDAELSLLVKPDGATLTPTLTPEASTNTPTPSASPSATPTCAAPWKVVTSPNVGFDDNYLQGVAAIGTNNAWAVGYYVNSFGIEQTLIQHWDGVRWSIVASPNAGTPTAMRNFLLSVTALATNDIWAVGYHREETVETLSVLTLHWDGNEWSMVASPIVGVLNGVSGVAADDVWAVGTTDDVNLNGGTPLTLTIHWDGQSWQVVPSPNFDPDDDVLYAVTAIASDDVWAAGHYGFYQRLLLEHWDGTEWSMVFVAEPWKYNDVFYAIDALASDDIWTVGKCCHDPQRTISYHWDGTDWTRIFTPANWDYSLLLGVTAVSHDNVWAVGMELGGGKPLFHWNGTSWSRANTSFDTYAKILRAADNAGADDVWAVGNNGYYQPLLKSTLTVHYDGICPDPNPDPSTTPAPSPTPTSCPIQFTDVPEGSTFYPYVRCLACRGILSGYEDGTFRPNDPHTRGQAAKIVSNAAGYSDPIPSSRQTFSDIPPSHTFWLYAERAFLHGVFEGYPCGDPGEPCDDEQRPYYRPATNPTRGQLAKIVSNAAGYLDEIPASQESFSDVLSTYSQWIYVERAVAHSILSGYPCGGAGEPCDPYNRPYFRPAANVTRGQTAKVVANTFYPGCQTP